MTSKLFMISKLFLINGSHNIHRYCPPIYVTCSCRYYYEPGFGLFISKSIVELHAGTIEVPSHDFRIVINTKTHPH